MGSAARSQRKGRICAGGIRPEQPNARGLACFVALARGPLGLMMIALLFSLIASTKAYSDYHVQNIIGSSGKALLPASIEIEANTEGTILVADEVELKDARYQRWVVDRAATSSTTITPEPFWKETLPANTIIVADTITISGAVEFDLSGRNSISNTPENVAALSGGGLTLVANRIVFEPRGDLLFTSYGTSSYGMWPRVGGKLKVIAKQVEMSAGTEERLLDQITADDKPIDVGTAGSAIEAEKRKALEALVNDAFDADGRDEQMQLLAGKSTWDDDLIDWSLRAVRQVALNKLRASPWTATAGRLFSVVPIPLVYAKDLPPIPSPGLAQAELSVALAIPDSDEALVFARSEWKTQLSKALALKMGECSANADWIGFTNCANRFSSLQDVRVVSRHVNDFLVWLNNISSLVDHAPVVCSEPLNIQNSGGQAVSAIVYYIAGDPLVYAAPTMALLSPVTIGETLYSGFYRMNDGKQYIDFNARFSIPQDVEEAIRSALRSRGLRYGGILTAWTLTPRPITFPGVDAQESRIVINGTGLSGTICFSGAIANAEAALANQGIPLEFDWTYHHGAKTDNGSMTGIAISRKHCDYAALRVADGKVEHRLSGSRRFVATPRFAIADKSVHYFPEPFSVVAPGASIDLPKALQGRYVEIPPESIDYDVGEDINPSHNFRIRDGDFVDVKLVNNLGEFDRLTQHRFDKLDLRLTYLSSDGTNDQSAVRTLSPKYQQFGEAIVGFLRTGQIQIRVSGTAYYDLLRDKVDLKPDLMFNSTLIEITNDMLVGQ